MTERRDQLVAPFRMRLAERDPVVGAEQRLGDGGRTGIGGGDAVRVVRADGFKIGREQRRDRRRRRCLDEPRDPVRFRAGQIVTPRPRMRVDEAELRGFPLEIDEDARENRVLDDIGEIPGVEGVTVVQRRLSFLAA